MNEASPCGTLAAYKRHVANGEPTDPACRRANTEYVHGGDTGLVDSTGTARRLQALAALGWCLTELAARMGTRRSVVGYLRDATRQKINAATADRVRDLYDQLSMVVPVGNSADRAKRYAQQRRWAPPLAWDDDTIDDPATRSNRGYGPVEGFDEIALERAMAGEPVRLTKAETAEVVRRLTDDGHSAADIAARLNLSSRAVVRWRSHTAHLEQAS